jgi:hypothetical protein
VANDIVQIKPTIYGVGIDLIAMWRKLRRSGLVGTTSVAARFISLFDAHGVVVAQIPRLIPGIGLHQLTSPEALLPALTGEVMERACELFGVRREWLEGVDSRMYPLRFSYKNPRQFFDELRSLRNPVRCMPVRALTTRKFLDAKSAHSQRVELVLVEEVATFDDFIVERYAPLSDGRDWCYKDHRIEIKAIVRAYGGTVPLYECSREEIDAVYQGSIVPRRLMSGCLISEPSLEDYCMSRQQNVHAKELDELDEVVRLSEGLAQCGDAPLHREERLRVEMARRGGPV